MSFVARLTTRNEPAVWSPPLTEEQYDPILRCQRSILDFFQSHAVVTHESQRKWKVALSDEDVEALGPQLQELDACVEKADLPSGRLSHVVRLYPQKAPNSSDATILPKGYSEVSSGPREVVGYASPLMPQWVKLIKKSGHHWPCLRNTENGEIVGSDAEWTTRVVQMLQGSRIEHLEAIAQDLPETLEAIITPEPNTNKNAPQRLASELLALERGNALLENLCIYPDGEISEEQFEEFQELLFVPEERRKQLASLLKENIPEEEEAAPPKASEEEETPAPSPLKPQTQEEATRTEELAQRPISSSLKNNKLLIVASLIAALGVVVLSVYGGSRAFKALHS